MSNPRHRLDRRDYPFLAARVILGIMFLYLGAVKAADPVAFLKMLRQFQIVEIPLMLNLIAAVLPWFEIFCGLLLIVGWNAQAAGALTLAMLVGFTGAVAWRAFGIYGAESIAFCSIQFDCGCGSGVVRICTKLAENSMLMIFAAIVLADKNPRFCLGST